MISRHWIANAVSVLVGGAIAALVIANTGGGTSRPNATQPKRLSPPSAERTRDNRQRLSTALVENLTRRAGQIQTCLVERGIDAKRVQVSPKEIVIPLAGAVAAKPMKVLRALEPCGKAVFGGPPKGLTLIFGDGAIRLYKPRFCLVGDGPVP